MALHPLEHRVVRPPEPPKGRQPIGVLKPEHQPIKESDANPRSVWLNVACDGSPRHTVTLNGLHTELHPGSRWHCPEQDCGGVIEIL